MDPLSADPVVVTGSANFSNNSVMRNDENMLLIRGDKRAADIYFTEFNRVFNFFYLGMALQNMKAEEKKSGISLFLDPTDGWLKKYQPGELRYKRVKAFAAMQV
jgi:phosphatidylserine/phosphatidylglycerophosphate/cardiolipin synthase-like enzyme